jgi:SAM-dependent methyltransferase
MDAGSRAREIAPEPFAYSGSELELFADAITWKRYFAAVMRPYLGPRVLEVGAGIGGTTAVLTAGAHALWLCLEPDPVLAARLQERCRAGSLPPCCAVRHGTLADLPQGPGFDTVLYIDVLEHIENDRDELERAAQQLRPGGRLAVLAPAHQALFSPFDRSVGHFRRYSRRGLLALAPPGLDVVAVRYLDSVGLLASLGNRLLLRSDLPGARQIWFWDRFMVPLSRLVDPLLAYRIGKSVLAVWRRS